MKANLLHFFRDGHFNGVKPGDSRQHVESLLDLPDLHVPGHSQSPEVRKAALWYYASVQLAFIDLENDLLEHVGFKPPYLKPGQYRIPENEKTELELWIFKGEEDPGIHDLKRELSTAQIPFKDTGLKSVVFNQVAKNYEVIPYDADAEESFGTLVLKSSVQVRYRSDGKILGVQIGGKGWMYRRKAQHISW